MRKHSAHRDAHCPALCSRLADNLDSAATTLSEDIGGRQGLASDGNVRQDRQNMALGLVTDVQDMSEHVGGASHMENFSAMMSIAKQGTMYWTL